MVTIGVFGRQDYDEINGPRSREILDLIDRYPLNLLNGQFSIIERRPGQPDHEQRSLLVRIPE